VPPKNAYIEYEIKNGTVEDINGKESNNIYGAINNLENKLTRKIDNLENTMDSRIEESVNKKIKPFMDTTTERLNKIHNDNAKKHNSDIVFQKFLMNKYKEADSSTVLPTLDEHIFD
jgi:hypothetical protein